MNKKDKRGFELAISTLVIITLSILVLIALIVGFSMGWREFWSTIKGYEESDMQTAINQCENDCNLNMRYDYCCEVYKINNENITCLDLVNQEQVDCEINCDNVDC